MMILVLAGRSDVTARSIVARWSDHGARLLLPEGLSVAGWRHRAGDRGGSQAMVDDAAVSVEDVRAVLVRTPGVMAADLPHIREEDREYVAAEMTAFLLAWLSSLDRPVFNRPTPGSLQGPALRREQWIALAARAGVPVAPVRRTTADDVPEGMPCSTAVVVVGDRCIGATTEALRKRALAVARAAGVSLLDAYFTGPPEDPALTGADVWVDLQHPRVSDAVLALLLAGEAGPEEVLP